MQRKEGGFSIFTVFLLLIIIAICTAAYFLNREGWEANTETTKLPEFNSLLVAEYAGGFSQEEQMQKVETIMSRGEVFEYDNKLEKRPLPIPDNLVLQDASYSPDGRHILLSLCQREGYNLCGLYLYERSSQALSSLTSHDSNGDYASPGWLSGSRVVFIYNKGGINVGGFGLEEPPNFAPFFAELTMEPGENPSLGEMYEVDSTLKGCNPFAVSNVGSFAAACEETLRRDATFDSSLVYVYGPDLTLRDTFIEEPFISELELSGGDVLYGLKFDLSERDDSTIEASQPYISALNSNMKIEGIASFVPLSDSEFLISEVSDMSAYYGIIGGEGGITRERLDGVSGFLIDAY